MGITYSKDEDISEDKRDIFRGLSHEKVKVFVSIYSKHSTPPILDFQDLSFFVRNSMETNENDDMLILSIWEIFSRNDFLLTHEFLSSLILLSDCNWKMRLDLLFDLFKCLGIDEIMYDDVIMAFKSIIFGMSKIWKQNPNYLPIDEISRLCEDLASHSYAKFDKDIEESLNRQEFVSWAFERFKESRTIANFDSLKLHYTQSQF